MRQNGRDTLNAFVTYLNDTLPLLEASEDKLRLPKLSLGEPKGSRLVCGNPSPK